MNDWYAIIFLASYPAAAVLGLFIGRLIWRQAERQALKKLHRVNMEQIQSCKDHLTSVKPR